MPGLARAGAGPLPRRLARDRDAGPARRARPRARGSWGSTRAGSTGRSGSRRPSSAGFTSRSATWASRSRSAARRPTGFWPRLLAAGGVTGPAGILDRPAGRGGCRRTGTPARLDGRPGSRLGRERGVLQALPVLLRDPRRAHRTPRPPAPARPRGDRGGGSRRVPNDRAGGRPASARHGPRRQVQHHVLRRERAPPRPRRREDHFTAEAVRDPAARALASPRAPLAPGRCSTSRGPGPSCGSATGSVREKVGDLRLGRDPDRAASRARREVRALVEPRLGEGRGPASPGCARAGWTRSRTSRSSRAGRT